MYMVIRFIRILFLFIVTILCSCNRDEEELNRTLKETASDINNAFVNIRHKVVELDMYIEELYLNDSPENYSSSGLLVEEGGPFEIFENVMLHRLPVKAPFGVLISSGTTPVDNMLLKKVAFMDKNILPKVEKTQKSYSFISTSWFFTPENLVAGFPYMDVVSTFPPRMDFFSFPWATMAYDNETWTEDPFISLASGWFMTFGSPVKVNNRLVGVVTSDVAMVDFSRTFIDEKDTYIILMSENTTLVGMSEKLSEKLNSPVLSSVAYLEQLTSHPEAAEETKMIHKSRDPGLRIIAEKVLGGINDFNVEINGHKYRVFHKKIPEVSFYLIGLL